MKDGLPQPYSVLQYVLRQAAAGLFSPSARFHRLSSPDPRLPPLAPGICDDDIAMCYCPPETKFGHQPAPPGSPLGTPPAKRGRPMYWCQPSSVGVVKRGGGGGQRQAGRRHLPPLPTLYEEPARHSLSPRPPLPRVPPPPQPHLTGRRRQARQVGRPPLPPLPCCVRNPHATPSPHALPHPVCLRPRTPTSQDADGKPVKWGAVTYADLLGPNGWCNSDVPKFQCPCRWVQDPTAHQLRGEGVPLDYVGQCRSTALVPSQTCMVLNKAEV